MKTIDLDTLASVSGGMNLNGMCYSYNVEDRRKGHLSPAGQRAQTDAWNRAAGCPTYSELHPTAKK